MARHSATEKPSRLRSAVGILGELLITAGLFIFLFIFWQVYWTNIGANKEQDRLISAFHEEIAPAAEPAEESAERRDTPPPLDRSKLGAVDSNQLWGVIYIPRFGPDYAVGIAEGISEKKVLDKGSVGHYPETQVPGELGNMALAGHRQMYGAPFDLPQIQVGDSIVIETEENWYVYKVTSDEIVLPTQTEVLLPVPHQPEAEPDKYLITLTTCHPPWVSNERWITYGELDYWMPRDAGTPKELSE